MNTCPICNRLTDDYNWDASNNCCMGCSPRNSGNFLYVKSYHTKPHLYFYTKYGAVLHTEKELTFGIELEFTNGDNEKQLLRKLWKLYDFDTQTGRYELYYNRDCSIGSNGIELITQPHTWPQFKKMKWKKILKTITDHGYSSHDNGLCGLHMHVSRLFFGNPWQQDRAINKLLNFCDAFYSEIIKISRRDSGEANRWAARYFTNRNKDNMATKEAYDNYKSIIKQGYYSHSERYHILNVTNENTVEFRIMRGTLKYETFMACLDFLYRLCVNVKHIKFNEMMDASKWLRGISQNTKDYLRSRGAFLEYLD